MASGRRSSARELELADFVRGASLIDDNAKVPVGLHRTGVIGYFFMLR